MVQLLYEDTSAQIRIDYDVSESFAMNTGVRQGCILSPILFNVYIDYIMKQVIQQANVQGVTLSYRLGDFWLTDRGNGSHKVHLLTLMYADDIVVMCDSPKNLEHFIKVFERVTNDFGLSMNIQKTCTMSLKQFEKTIGKNETNGKEKDASSNIVIRDQNIETVDDFNYLGCNIANDQTQAKEIEVRIGKASSAFNSLRRIAWYRKCISIQAKVRIFKACILPVLLYGSEIWCLKAVEEQRLNTFYMKCLRTLLGVGRGDRMRNDLILELTGQPSLEKILRRNRLRWFGHVNRMNNEEDQPMLPKKVLFSSFADAKRPLHGVKLRWKDKIAKDLTMCEIKNWRREVQDKEMWRKTINKEIKSTTVRSDAAHVIHEHKERAKKRRTDERLLDYNKKMNTPPSTTTVINVDATCSICGRTFKSKLGTNIHKRVCIQNSQRMHQLIPKQMRCIN
ncbi:unnamed protein product [Rotaria magnacalcarata]|uniref:Reverse transcriptase domain-containing protein n=3 Tax=Rotaria magnacalcarata TaxID=392030 RepID=A0A814Q2H1_9BILA|nr:unnamed protein product [Rotaria magnacalcarata]